MNSTKNADVKAYAVQRNVGRDTVKKEGEPRECNIHVLRGCDPLLYREKGSLFNTVSWPLPKLNAEEKEINYD